MDTPRIAEWNMWYHLLNCGFPLKVSGETDFPCMSGLRVGQGRVYVRLGDVEAVDFDAWCAGLAAGRSYVSDGYAHALEFTVGGKRPGDRLELERPGDGRRAGEGRVRRPDAARGGPRRDRAGRGPQAGRRHGQPPRAEARGRVLREAGPAGSSSSSTAARSRAGRCPADDRVHELEFPVPIERSSWVALRHFPQLHTNPVDVLVGGRPIRASRRSALWCLGAAEQLWRPRGRSIATGRAGRGPQGLRPRRSRRIAGSRRRPPRGAELTGRRI